MSQLNLQTDSPPKPQSAKKQLLTVPILCVLLIEILLDFVYLDQRPEWLSIIFYLMLAVALLACLAFGRNKISDVLVVLFVVFISLIHLIWTPPELKLQDIQYVGRVAIVTLLVYVALESQAIDYRRLRRLFLKTGVPLTVILTAWFLLKPPERYVTCEGVGLTTCLNENAGVIHIPAQIIAKIGLIWTGSLIPIVIVIATLVVLNVRSALLAFLAAQLPALGRLARKNAMYVVLILAACVLALAIISISGGLDALQDSLIFRQRDLTLDVYSTYDPITSGRFHIWTYWINHLTQSTETIQLLFGQGLAWITTGFGLEGHNDVINIALLFGLTGVLTYAVLLVGIIKRIDPKYKWPIILLLLVLALTNNFLFYASNLLLILYGGGREIDKSWDSTAEDSSEQQKVQV